MPRQWIFIANAGTGVRMGAPVPKQYLEVNGRALLCHTLDTWLAYAGECDAAGIVIGIADGDGWWEKVKKNYPSIAQSSGGASRMETVWNGLQTLAARADDGDWVMVHDAVRPCVSRGDIVRLAEAVGGGGEGAVLGCPLADSVKCVGEGGRIIADVERKNLWRVFTPQMFRYAQLRDALARARARGEVYEDEAGAVQAAGGRPLLVAGAAGNIKVTTPDDLALAAAWLGAGRGRG